jgi:murein DD-endopeptidase MepM/ murein hydrolase activator NlpD
MARLAFRGEVDSLNRYNGWPITGTISSRFGVVRETLSKGKGHSGLDIAAPIGTPVYAPMDGVVNDVFTTEETVAWRKNVAAIFGNSVFMRHSDSDGSLLGYTLYAHFDSPPSVSRSESVEGGDEIGVVGSTGQSTGPHLHWGCTIMDNPYFSRAKGLNDPLNFLVAESASEPAEDYVLPDYKEIDEQQKKANDMMDAAQSMLNDIIDTLQGKEEDME